MFFSKKMFTPPASVASTPWASRRARACRTTWPGLRLKRWSAVHRMKTKSTRKVGKLSCRRFSNRGTISNTFRNPILLNRQQWTGDNRCNFFYLYFLPKSTTSRNVFCKIWQLKFLDSNIDIGCNRNPNFLGSHLNLMYRG